MQKLSELKQGVISCNSVWLSRLSSSFPGLIHVGFQPESQRGQELQDGFTHTSESWCWLLVGDPCSPCGPSPLVDEIGFLTRQCQGSLQVSEVTQGHLQGINYDEASLI